jgi:Protein of unknown function (DUF3301)
VLEELLLASALLGAGWLFFDGIRIRERALAIGRDQCAKLGVQFLDETVSLQRVGFARAKDGRLHIRRRFGFEFTSDGERRYRGALTMLGAEVSGVDMDLHRILH